MTIKDGIYVASMSVLNPDLKLNSKQTLIHAEKLISLGAEGVVLGGSTGQSQFLSNECKMSLIDQASRSLQNEKIIIGPGTNSLLDTAKLINYAKTKNLKKSYKATGETDLTNTEKWKLDFGKNKFTANNAPTVTRKFVSRTSKATF